MTTCPAGHPSAASDYCDVCGLPLTTDAVAPTPTAPVVSARPCPTCGAQNSPDALFCEACGYDYTTGTPPRSAESPARVDEPAAAVADEVDAPAPMTELSPPVVDVPAPVVDVPTPVVAAPAPVADAPAAATATEWVAELWIDPDWYATQGSTDPLPSPGLPEIVALQRPSLLVGRLSVSRNIHPDIECDLDTGVSRRHAQLTTDGTRWWVEDLDSANGTFVGSAAGPLPSMPIPRGRTEVAPDQRLYLGAWTRLVIRRATDEERQAFA